VGDVTAADALPDESSGHDLPATGAIAKVRNESAYPADVTIRFVEDETVVYLAFVHVLPGTETSVSSAKPADTVRLSGVDERGLALAGVSLVYGVDFDDAAPALYTIPATETQPGDPPTDTASPSEDVPVIEPPLVVPPTYVPPAVTVWEPAADLTLVAGETFTVRWQDSSPLASTVVWLGLRSLDRGETTELLLLGPAVGAALDGLNDRFLAVVQGVPPGFYEVVARIDDGLTAVSSAAPGHVEIQQTAENVAPQLTIVAPAQPVELSSDAVLYVAWMDADPDDNATIVFSVEPTELRGALGGSFVISPPVAEDPDGPLADAARLTLEGVLPGLYDLIGTIDDGQLVGSDRVVGAVHILAEPDNDPPTLTLLDPTADTDVQSGGSFLVSWTDSDVNDNARLSLLLDTDLELSELDGDEILLVAGISEDEDGPGDRILLGVPAGVAAGVYRVVGALTDGQVVVLAAAPGLLRIGEQRAADDTLPASEAEELPPSPPPGPPPPPPDPPPGGGAVLEVTHPADQAQLRAGDAFAVRGAIHGSDIAPAAIQVSLVDSMGKPVWRWWLNPPDQVQAEPTFSYLLVAPAVLDDILTDVAQPFRVDVEVWGDEKLLCSASAPASLMLRRSVLGETVPLVAQLLPVP